MSENITEKEALKADQDFRDRLIDSLFENVSRLQLLLIANRTPKGEAAGIRVVDGDGNSHEYPSADGADGSDGLLRVFRGTEDDNRTLAMFRHWDYVERINDPL